MELCQLTIHELQDKIKTGETTASDIVESVYRRIEAVERTVHAYITLTRELAFEQAAVADGLIKKGDIKELTGIPIALKDILCTRG
ncbi:MAG: amidase family protein, partial [Syntrophales bacterium]|nr:amidase family protein [Syntrophales bacterium]